MAATSQWPSSVDRRRPVSPRVRAHACARAQLRISWRLRSSAAHHQPQSTARQRPVLRAGAGDADGLRCRVYRIIRRAEGKDGWLAMASLASVAPAPGSSVPAPRLFMVVAYRPATIRPSRGRSGTPAGWPTTPPGLRLARGSRSSPPPRSAAPSAAAMDRLDRGPGSADQPRRSARRQAGTGAFSPQGWFALVVGLMFALWLLALSVAAWRSPRAPTTAGSLRVKSEGAHAELG